MLKSNFSNFFYFPILCSKSKFIVMRDFIPATSHHNFPKQEEAQNTADDPDGSVELSLKVS